MLSLKTYPNTNDLSDIRLQADLNLISADSFELNFKWVDLKNEIVFNQVQAAKRQMGLWQHTCFEAFIKPIQDFSTTNYYEVNFSDSGAWNLFHFTNYREPQPPQELSKADLVCIDVQKNANGGLAKAIFKIKDANFQQVKISLCAVVVTKTLGTTYWSFKHADSKPNFHHFESFIIERSMT